MIDPIQKAMEIVKEQWARDEHPDDIIYALVEAGLIPTRGDWGVLESGRSRIFGSEEKAREFAAKHESKVIHVWSYDYQIVE